MAGSRLLTAAMFRPLTGGVTLPSYLDKGSTNFGGSVLCFADTAIKESAYTIIAIPDDFPATPVSVTFTVVWTSTITNGNFQCDIDYRLVGGNDTTSLNQAAQQALTVADAAPTVAHRKLDVILSATAANFNSSQNNVLLLQLSRDGATESSGIAGDVLVALVNLAWT